MRARAETCGQILINHKTFDRAFDPVTPHACTCHRYPKEWRRRRQFDGHFCILSEEYNGPGAAALQCSHKTPIETTSSEVYAELYRSVCGLRQTLPLELRAVTTDQMITDVVKSIIRDHCGPAFRREQQPAKLEGRVLKRDVLASKKYLRHACISSVDKGAGRMAIMCPVVQHTVMQKSWPSEPDRCTIVCGANSTEEAAAEAEAQIIAADIDTYRRAGWQRIAKLYGVRGRGEQVNCALPRVYALIKLKAILAASPGKRANNVVKGRPIGPHTRHHLKHVYNRVATAHHFMLTMCRTRRVTRLWNTADYPRRLMEEHQQLQARHSARGGGLLRFVDRFGDLEGMYTNCPHAAMNAALRRNIQRLRDSTQPDRRYPARVVDRVTVSKCKSDGIKACTLGPAYNQDE
eukprot:SAG11_NODE_1805_length_4229_cov_1.746005_3_plen_406_part_00